MKRIIFMLLISLVACTVAAQSGAPSKKCPTCGLSIPKCKYKGRHPKPPKTKLETNPRPEQKPQTPAKPTSGYISGHEWVDLGLSVKWATYNVGATSPEDYGDYFAWGETRTKSSYTDKTCNTYNKSVSELQRAGIINGKGELTMSYDAARVNWGGTWRMPTKTEFDELLRKCKWTWTSQGGKKGYKVTGPNKNSIFVPAAGGYYDSTLYDEGEIGRYWSSAVEDSTEGAYDLFFHDGDHRTTWDYRDHGRSVRAVSE